VRAGALLGVLLLHLAFMASPLHAAMLGMSEAIHAAEISPSGPMARQDDPAAADGHCFMEWARPPEGQAGLTAFSAPLPDSIAALPREVAANRPIARAHGPPPHADVQALLQVFRL
jgi:hypothetical protein